MGEGRRLISECLFEGRDIYVTRTLLFFLFWKGGLKSSFFLLSSDSSLKVSTNAFLRKDSSVFEKLSRGQYFMKIDRIWIVDEIHQVQELFQNVFNRKSDFVNSSCFNDNVIFSFSSRYSVFVTASHSVFSICRFHLFMFIWSLQECDVTLKFFCHFFLNHTCFFLMIMSSELTKR